jgi:glutamine cyclotransferase
MRRVTDAFWPWLLTFLGTVAILSCAVSPGLGEGYAWGPATNETPAREQNQAGSGAGTALLVPTSPAPVRPDVPSIAGAVPTYSYRVVNTYDHDPGAFTQGLVFEAGFLYEGTGFWEQSSLRKVELETGDVLQFRELPDVCSPNECFGEGITIYDQRIIQLTWVSRVGFVYDKATFRLTDDFTYPTEGWGITHDGVHLIMSDGTSTLHFWDPQTFEELYQVQVYDGQVPVTRLNELEYIQGEVYANVWQTDFIAIVHPQTGQVTGWIDLTGLLNPAGHTQPVDVLNGIAYDAEGDRLFVTGKWWPKLFEIELIPPNYVFLPIVGE